MTHFDYQLWTLAVDEIGRLINEDKDDDEIKLHITRLTHGFLEPDDIGREIIRQRRLDWE